MFQRKVYGYLKNWKEESNGSSAVLIEGARRVGKSTTAEAFAKTEYDDYILYVEDDDIASLTQKIVNVCELSDAEREAIGQKARLFVTEQKNEIVQ